MTRDGAATPLEIVPVTFREACSFVKQLHRHNKPPRGMKMCVGVRDGSGVLRGVAIAGRPIARAFDDGRTLEVTRTCTDGCPNANSCLYGAIRRAAWALGYWRLVTYTQAGESGGSLRGAGWVKVRDLAPRPNWAESTKNPDLRAMRDPSIAGNVERQLWEVRRGVGSS